MSASAYAKLQYPCVLDIPLTFLPICLGKVCLDTRIGWLDPEVYDPAIKFCIQSSVTHIESHSCIYMLYGFNHLQLLHGAICFVAFGNRSGTYGITLVCLHVFHFLSHSDMHTAYIESWLKSTHCLFQGWVYDRRKLVYDVTVS